MLPYIFTPEKDAVRPGPTRTDAPNKWQPALLLMSLPPYDLGLLSLSGAVT
jgi:hypothetical protein